MGPKTKGQRGRNRNDTFPLALNVNIHFVLLHFSRGRLYGAKWWPTDPRNYAWETYCILQGYTVCTEVLFVFRSIVWRAKWTTILL